MGLRSLAVVDSVLCLACGTEYVKPIGGGTLATNPGCPGCGYAGWLSLARSLRGRFAAGLRQQQTGRSG